MNQLSDSTVKYSSIRFLLTQSCDYGTNINHTNFKRDNHSATNLKRNSSLMKKTNEHTQNEGIMMMMVMMMEKPNSY